MRAATLSLLVAACATPYALPMVVSDPAVIETLSVRPYSISGGNNGTRGNALTTSDVQYDFALVEEPGSCRMKHPRVQISIVQLLPVAHHGDPAVDVSLLNGMDILVKHEAGHLQIDRASAHDLARALRAIPRQASCSDVREAARTAAAQAFASCRAMNVAYDAANSHGTKWIHDSGLPVQAAGAKQLSGR